MQLDVDLDTLRDFTGLEPVQLAIDGSNYLRVLEDLADDPHVTGTVLVGADTRKLLPSRRRDRADEWVDFYHEHYRGLWGPAIEARLKGWVQGWSALYASGIPLDRLAARFFDTDARISPFYLLTRPSRERDADYRLVKQPDFYIGRVLRHLGQEIDFSSIRTMADFNGAVRRALDATPAGKALEPERFDEVNRLIEKLQARGVEVALVRLPSSGLVWEIDEHRWPRALGWDRFVAQTSACTVHFRDYSELSIDLPDGSHLDMRDKPGFTRALIQVLIKAGMWH